nr:hypothetical protein [Tanacetum cinerariifolium]
GAAWLRKAWKLRRKSRSDSYLDYIQQHGKTFGATDNIYEFGWDNKHAGLNVLVSQSLLQMIISYLFNPLNHFERTKTLRIELILSSLPNGNLSAAEKGWVNCIKYCVRSLSRLEDISFARCRRQEIEGKFKLQVLSEISEEILCSLGWMNIEYWSYYNVSMADSDGNYRFLGKVIPKQMLYEHGIFSTYLRGQEVPKWFTHRSNEPSFTVPSSPKNCRICGLNLCIVSTIEDDFILYYTDDGGTDCANVREYGISLVYDDGIKKEDPLAYYKSWNHIISRDLSAAKMSSGRLEACGAWRVRPLGLVLVGYNVVCTAPVYMCQCKRLHSISSYTYMMNTIQILLLAAGIIMRDTKETAAVKIWFSISIFQYHDPEKEARYFRAVF